ncbi:MAG: flagellar M-ring protein FliF [Oscillospiraceae bacterium]|nr:flagellar M-ring protein FliF [Oscillospiraceae bacterium]
MNERVQKTVTVVKEFWSSKDKKTKGLLIGGLAAVLIVAIVAVILLNRKDYVVLYENLENTEAAEIVALIEDAGYECTLKGGTITVPEGTENAIAMSLALQKYPRSQLNYPTYTENVGMFTTESESLEYEQIALQERLSSIIASMTDVRDAEVTLFNPPLKNTVIEVNKRLPSAAATIYLRDGVELTNEQIEGITYLIANSSGVAADNVSLVDGNGVPLVPKDIPVDEIAEEIRRLRFKNELENQINAKIRDLLVRAYGEEGFSSAVNMVLNFDTKVYEDTVYTPSTNDERGMLQHTDASQASGYATAQGGIVGVEVNADDTYPTGDTAGNGQWTENSVSNTYLVNTYKEQVEKAGYVIDGLSISVVIYTDYLPDVTRQDLVELVGNAATVNPELFNEVVSVISLNPFNPDVAADSEAILFGLTLDQLILLGAILLAILIILIIVLASISSRNKKRRRSFEKTLLEQHALPEGETLVEDFFTIGDQSFTPAEMPSLLAENEVETKEQVIRRELADFAKNSPEIVAQLLRNWIKGDEDAVHVPEKSAQHS